MPAFSAATHPPSPSLSASSSKRPMFKRPSRPVRWRAATGGRGRTGGGCAAPYPGGGALDSASRRTNGSEKSTSCEDSSSDDEYGENKGGVQQSVCSASKMRQESPGPVVLKPSKAMDKVKPSSTSKSADPSHGTQSTPTCSQHAGIGVIQQELDTAVSIMEADEWFLKEPEADDDVPDEFEEKLDTLQARLNYLAERARVAHDRCAEVLARLGSPEDHPSGK